MTAIKCMLYCAKAEPYLAKVVELGKYYTVGKKDMKTLPKEQIKWLEEN